MTPAELSLLVARLQKAANDADAMGDATLAELLWRAARALEDVLIGPQRK
jgi:hypothetical protein